MYFNDWGYFGQQLIEVKKLIIYFLLFRAAILRLLWWEDCEGSYWFFYEFHMDHPKTFYQGWVGISILS